MKLIVEDAKELDRTYSKDGIRAYAICPGLVNTPLARNDFRQLAIEKVGKGLAGEALESALNDFWQSQVFQPLEVGQWVIDLIEKEPQEVVFKPEPKIVL